MIKRLSIFLLAACSLSVVSCSRSTLRPMALAQRIFSRDPFPELSQYSTLDYSGRPNGQDLPAGARTKFLLLQQSKQKAVIAMTTIPTDKAATDQYLFFLKDSSRWKLSAIASPTLRRVHERTRNEMQSMTAAQIDTVIAAAQRYEDPEYKDRADFDFKLNSLQLKLAPDDTLITHFLRHRSAFDSLRDAALLLKDKDATSLVNTQTPAYRPLLISNITRGGFLPEACLDFHILYDQVGYLYVQDEKDLPELYPDKVMMLRKISKGWYLYKVAIYL